MKKVVLLAGACVLTTVAALLISDVRADDKKKKDIMELITCPISGKEVNKKATAEHNKGKVFFCCGNCVNAFGKDPSKWITKANFQLVATEQYKQKGCPLSGGKVKASTIIKVALGDAKVPVGFCCPKCQGKAEGAKGDKQLDLLFSAKAFGNAFKKVADGK